MDIVTYALCKKYTDKAIASVNPDAYIGETTTPLSDGATTNPIVINGVSVTAKSGQIAAYDDEEFIFNGTTWRKFGGSLAGLTDVNFTTPADGQYMRYNGTSGKWENVDEPFTVLIGTLTAGQTTLAITDSHITDSSIIDVFVNANDVKQPESSVSGTTLTMVFEEQSSDLTVKVVVI